VCGVCVYVVSMVCVWFVCVVWCGYVCLHVFVCVCVFVIPRIVSIRSLPLHLLDNMKIFYPITTESQLIKLSANFFNHH